MKVKNETATANTTSRRAPPSALPHFGEKQKRAGSGNTWMMYAPQSADGKRKELPRIPARMLSS